MKNLEQDDTISRNHKHIENSLRSIAISLKRIADKLELSQKQPVIMSAEEYAVYCDKKNGH